MIIILFRGRETIAPAGSGRRDSFRGIRINSRNPLTNYKLIDDIILELSNRLKIQIQHQA